MACMSPPCRLVVHAGFLSLPMSVLLACALTPAEPAAPRATLARTLGAEETLDPSHVDVVSELLALTDQLGADIAVDAVGSQLSTVLRVVRPAGRVVLFGMNTTARAEIAQERITRRELTIFGSFIGGRELMPMAVSVLERSVIDLSPMVTHLVDIDGLPGALDEFRRGGAVKVEVAF
jgi:(R,R)-butanediol dehydrogenase / meso-butanediol dehydrogenase / diacetyl reductase